MDAIKEKLGIFAEKKWRDRAIIAGAVLLIALIVWLCISIHMRANIQRKYSSAAACLEEQLYENLCGMTQTFDLVDNPNIDVQNKLIPELKAQYSIVRALNTALKNGFGSQKAVLSDELVSAFDAAFEEYSSAYLQGSATGLAQADMSACIDDIQLLINDYYDIREAEKIETLSVS